MDGKTAATSSWAVLVLYACGVVAFTLFLLPRSAAPYLALAGGAAVLLHPHP